MATEDDIRKAVKDNTNNVLQQMTDTKLNLLQNSIAISKGIDIPYPELMKEETESEPLYNGIHML